MAEPEEPPRQDATGKAEKPSKAAEPDSPELEDLDVSDETEITERVRGGRRRISIP